jgi:hypothetical protein
LARKVVLGLVLAFLLVTMVFLGVPLTFGSATDGPMEWSYYYGGTGGDYIQDVIVTSGGLCALAGYTNSFGIVGFDALLVELDSSNIHWARHYGGSGDDYATSVIETSDGGYALTGYTNSWGAGGYDFWLVKINSGGTLEWYKEYGGAGDEYACSVVQTSDGGYALAGQTNSYGAGGYDLWLVKTDSSGNQLWNKTYGTSRSEYASCMIQTSDGGYAIAGSFDSADAGSDWLLYKLDSSGIIQWSHRSLVADNEYGTSVVQTGDGGYVIACYYENGSYGGIDCRLSKLNYSGGWVSNGFFGGAGNDYVYSVVQTSDGGFAIGGYTNSWGAGLSDFCLVKFDSSFNRQWNYTYGGTGSDFCLSVVQTSDGGYALAGRTNSYGSGGYDAWLVKVSPVAAPVFSPLGGKYIDAQVVSISCATSGATIRYTTNGVDPTNTTGTVYSGPFTVASSKTLKARAFKSGLLDSEVVTANYTITGPSPTDGPMEWSKTYGGTRREQCFSVVRTADGGYALAGHTNSFGAGERDAWLVKTDSSGNMQWNKTYGGTGDEYASSVVQTSDGGYALACTRWIDSARDVWLLKTDSSGNMQWNKTYGRGGDGAAHSMIQTADGGYALAGQTYGSGGGLDAWLLKTDSSGNMQWNKTYGGTGTEIGLSVVRTADGGYALAGQTSSFGAGDWDAWLIKTNSAGNQQWNKTFGGPNQDDGKCVVQSGDGGYVIAGYTRSYGDDSGDFWLFKTNSSGDQQWSNTYGGTDHDNAWSMVQTNDGGYAICGETYSFGAGERDVYFVKTDGGGNMQWNKTYGGTGTEMYESGSVVQTTDGGYAIAGDTTSYGVGDLDFWLVKVPSDAHAYLAVRGSNNIIYYCTYSAFASTWNSWTALPGSSNDPPAAAVMGSNNARELHIVVRGANSLIWHGYVNLNTNAFSGWTQLSGTTPSPPTLTANSTHLCLVVRGSTNNMIYYRFYTLASRVWSDWAGLPAGTTPDTPAAQLIDNKLQIVVRSSNGNSIFHGTLDLASNTFSGWNLLDGATPSPPVLTSLSGYLCLVVRGSNSAIYYRWYSLVSSTWSSWNVLPVGTTPDVPAATITGDTYLQIVVRGSNYDQLWHGNLNIYTSAWSGWTQVSGTTPSKPVLTS